MVDIYLVLKTLWALIWSLSFSYFRPPFLVSSNLDILFQAPLITVALFDPVDTTTFFDSTLLYTLSKQRDAQVYYLNTTEICLSDLRGRGIHTPSLS